MTGLALAALAYSRVLALLPSQDAAPDLGVVLYQALILCLGVVHDFDGHHALV